MSENENNLYTEQHSAHRVHNAELITEKFQRQKRRRRIFRILRRCGILLVLLAILFGAGYGIYHYWHLFQPETLREAVTLRDETKSLMKIGGALDIITGNTAHYTAFADGLAVVTTTGIRYATEDGEEGFLSEYELTQPTAVSEGDYLAVYDRGGRFLYLADESGELATATAVGTLIDLSVNANGTSVAVTEADGYQCAVTVYDKQFNRQYLWKTPEYFATSGIASVEQNVFAVAVVQIQDNRLYHSVLLFDMQKEGVLAEIPIGKTAVIALHECDDGFLIVTESDVVCSSWDGTVCARVSLDGDRVCGIVPDSKAMFLLLEVDNDVTVRYRMVRIGSDGALVAERKTKSEIKSISASNGMLAVLTGHQICLYDAELDVKKYVSPEPGVKNIVLMHNNKLIMITPQEIFIA